MINGKEPMQPIVKQGFVYGDGSYEEPYVRGGLTIREHFASMAMQGLLSNAQFCKNLSTIMDNTKEFLGDTVESRDKYYFENISKVSLQAADSLINELNKPNGND